MELEKNRVAAKQPSLCIDCKEYYVNAKNKCSICLIGKTEHEWQQELKRFCIKRHLKHRFLKQSEFKLLLTSCKQKSPLEISLTLDGFRDFPPTILLAKQADALLLQSQTESLANSENLYKFIHAICPFVVDPWNYQTNHSVLLCYYKDFGELIKCPSIQCVSSYWMFDRNSFTDSKAVKIDDCMICLEPVLLTQRIGRCKNCLKTIHGLCGDNLHKCANCQIEFDLTHQKKILQVISNECKSLQIGHHTICRIHKNTPFCKYLPYSKDILKHFLLVKEWEQFRKMQQNFKFTNK
jgi:hypothetical protein